MGWVLVLMLVLVWKLECLAKIPHLPTLLRWGAPG